MKALLCLVAAMMFLATPALAVDGLAMTWTVADATVSPGGQTTVQLTLTCPATFSSVQNIYLTVDGGPYLSVNPGTLNIAGISPGGSQQTAIDVRVIPSAVSTTSYLVVKATYVVSGVSRDTTVSIPVVIKREPILRIDNVSYTKQPEPGTSTVLSFYLINDGTGPAKDLSISMEQGTTVASAGSAGETYVKEIGPSGMQVFRFPITVSPSASTGIYSLLFTLSYYDETKSSPITVTKTVGIPIGGKANFVVSFESGNNFYIGRMGTASISIANAGSSPAEFLVVKASSPYGNQEIYVGNMDSDDTQTVDIQQDLSAANGPYDLDLELSWKDRFGNEYSETRHITLTPTSAPVEIGGWVFLIVLLAAGLAIWRRKKLMAFVSSKLKK